MEETTARGFAELREALASRTGTRPEDWFPVFKARYGMQVAFDAVRSVRGDGSVLTQLFTCCTAVDPIVVSGLRPRYADVGADTMGIDVPRWSPCRWERRAGACDGDAAYVWRDR